MQVYYKHKSSPRANTPDAVEHESSCQHSTEELNDSSSPVDSQSYSTSQPSTKYCHWNNSNVRKITASDAVQTSSGAGEFSATPTSIHVSPPPSDLVTGAFVSGKTAARAKAAIAGESRLLPFQDLLPNSAAGYMSEDNASQLSSSPESTGKEIIEKESKGLNLVPRRYSSSSSLSSKQSADGSSVAKTHHDYVMVDLNPAFARNDSSLDLGTFYRECENVPELIMFNEQNGTETNETLLDLTKQLEDYEQEITDFDAFLHEINATT
uniref:Uncharacterized protein n=1 Tax=Ciona savignyi TaxID=51511 RepID=H2YMS1_CIOSA